jgi:hypothetical protein
VNKSLGVQDSRFLVQMSPEFVCLMATALQWHLLTYVAAGKVVQLLIFNLINTGGESAFQWPLPNNRPLQQYT